MKKIIIGFLLLVLCGCGEHKQAETFVTTNGGIVRYPSDLGGLCDYEIHEFEYKAHTYIGCHVRDGISLTHAGHCSCNKNVSNIN